jgi:hypothetical protein
MVSFGEPYGRLDYYIVIRHEASLIVDHTVKRGIRGARFLKYYCLTVAWLGSVGHSNRAAPAAVAALSRRREARSAQADEA